MYNALPQIRDKTRLIVMDSIFAEYKWFNGRGQSQIDITNTLMFSTDPVAMDYVGWQMIEELRQIHGVAPVTPAPDFIHNAAVDYALGTDDPDQIDIVDIDAENDTPGSNPSPEGESCSGGGCFISTQG